MENTATTGHTGHTPATMACIWYIVINPDNTPIKDLNYEEMDRNKPILYLKKKIKEGGDLSNVILSDMDVWRFRLTTDDLDKHEIKDLLRDLKFSSDKDCDGQELPMWKRVVDLDLLEGEILVVRVKQKGA
jgi:hypothetical protein